MDGGEIRFENETAFDDSLDWAVSQWNAVGSVDYKKDTAFTNADLQVRDVNKTDVTWCGAYSKASGADNVFLNKKYYDTFTTNERRRCTTHELGHGLGIDDHQSASWKTKSIMFMCANCTTFLAPQAHDKSDYHSIWG